MLVLEPDWLSLDLSLLVSYQLCDLGQLLNQVGADASTLSSLE